MEDYLVKRNIKINSFCDLLNSCMFSIHCQDKALNIRYVLF